MPLVNKKPFYPEPIPENLASDEEVFYHELTNEIFSNHDDFFDRFLYCNSLIWTCSRTGKSGLTYKEALDSECTVRKKRTKREKVEQTTDDGSSDEPSKKKKKKYPYDPKKYSMPVPDGFDPSLLTPTGKIDGRKLKSKKNKLLAEELMANMPPPSPEGPKKRGRQKKEEDGKKKEDDAKRKEEEAKRKALMQAELAKEREFEAKRKKEAAALAKQLEKQKKEEEKKKAAAFLANWDKKCEDLERDDLKRLPQPTPLNCDLPERLFGDAIFILESLYNLHDLHNFAAVFPEGVSYDALEEMLLDKHEDGPLGTLVQFLLRVIFDTQPTGDGYGFDDPSKSETIDQTVKQENVKGTSTTVSNKHESETDVTHENTTNSVTSGGDEEDDEENDDKDVNMNDLIGSAIKAAQDVKMSLSKPLPEMEITSTNLTEILRLHLLQSGSFPKGRTIYNGWYSSREDPGLWLCMQEQDLIKKLAEVTIYDLEIDERIKILHTLIYQLFSFIKTRTYIESASDQLTELRKKYRHEAASFTKWDKENCVKRMQHPKKKGEQHNNSHLASSDKQSNGLNDTNVTIKSEHNHSNPSSLNGDGHVGLDDDNHTNNQQLKSCLKANGTTSTNHSPINDDEEVNHSKKKISFRISSGAIDENGVDDGDHEHTLTDQNTNGCGAEDSEQTYEELDRAYQQNLVDHEDYQRERAIRTEQLNQTLVEIRTILRATQAIYGIHPIGRDRGYRRYWLFQSLPGLYVEHDDEYVGRCLSSPTPSESLYKKLFNKDNPLMHTNEADLLRPKMNDASCPTTTTNPTIQAIEENKVQTSKPAADVTDNNPNEDQNDTHPSIDRLNGENHEDQDDLHDSEPAGISDEMNICTGDQSTCAVHGQKRPAAPRWWFYHQPESIDALIEGLNKRGYREGELLDVLIAENSIIKPRVAECPAYKLNKRILEQSGIRRSRRLRTKGSKRRGRKVVE